MIIRENIKYLISKLLFPFRNSFILFDIWRKASKNHVILNYWNRTVNLGDAISPIICEYMLSLKKIDSDSFIPERRHLYAVGSNLTSGIQDCTVWGSGVANIKCCYRLNNRRLDIRCVRGPLTKMVLTEYGYMVPDLYADPGILLTKIYNPTIKKIYKYGVIYHCSTQERKTRNTKEILYIDIVTKDYKKFVDEIKSVECVISSSLHGIILAEAYGIPAIMLKPEKDDFKYYDWYYATNRTKFPVAKSIEEATNINPVELPMLDNMYDILFKTFPYDIYRDKE